MRTKLLLLLAGALLIGFFAVEVHSQENKPPVLKAAPATDRAKGQSQTSESQPPTPAQLEAGFKTAMTKATFRGRWCVVKDGQPGSEKAEQYVIQGVNKVGADVWMVHARLQYGNKDVTVPIPVQVKWAGDTPVISITSLAIPNVGTYTARVVVCDNLYAGTWSGGDHGGLLSGAITHESE